MSASSNVFESAIAQAFAGNIKWAASGGDTMKMALLTASAAPNLATWQHYSDLTNEVANGNGYTTGGVALSSLAVTSTAANSWGTSWASTHAQNVGDIVIPATPNGYLYICVVAGTTGSAASVLNGATTVPGNTVVDGTVTWSCLGESITTYSSANASWTSSTFSAAYGVIYDAQSGTGSTEPLVALVNFGGTLSPSSGTLTVTCPGNGWFFTTPA